MARWRVLCIDDYELGLQILKHLLQEEYEVHTALDAASALELFGQMHFDAVVLDYKMPGTGGEAIAQELKQRDPSVPIVMLSAYPEDIPQRVLQWVEAFVAKGSKGGKELLDVLVGLGSKPPQKPTPEEITRKLERAAADALKLDPELTKRVSKP